MTTPKILGGVTLLSLVIIGWPVRGETLESAFVAGFDRFARHGEIEPVVAGRLLMTELSCAACHRSADASLEPSGGPRLDGVGNRLQADWLRAFLTNPQQAKPGTRMPDMLAGMGEAERAEAIDALVAFLSSQRTPYPEFKASGTQPLPHEFWMKGNIDQGRKLYHQVGCVACHVPDPEYQGGNGGPSMVANLLSTLDPEEIEDLGLAAAVRPFRSVPHSELAEKYTHKSLMAFLADPEAVRPNGRMPNLKLDLIEAADIAAYLIGDGQPVAAEKSPAGNAALVEQGRRFFSSLSCVNCHSAEGLHPAVQFRPLEKLNPNAAASCLGRPTAGLPVFRLDDLQVEMLTTALDDLKSPTLESRDREEATVGGLELTLLQQNCFACHERSGRGGVGPERQRYFETVAHTDLGDEGRLPPPLDHVGRKLTQEWLSKVLAGSGDLRPHMRARMPRFPAATVKHLPQAFREADEPNPPREAEVFPKQEGLLEAGRMLLDTGCVQCHPLRGESLMGTVGVDLQGVTDRVQPDWFNAFLRDPAALKKRTRMPSFFHEGQSTNPEILGGNVDAQIVAIWTYLENLTTARLPDKIEKARSQQFELVPKQRPILLRTFMKEAGPHAIAVGFPEHVHYAFDAEAVRLAQAWRGRFLDAYGTWFVRAAPEAEPLGTDIVQMPPGFPFALVPEGEAEETSGVTDEAGPQFSGYRLDPQGVPTLLYRFGGFEIEDRLEATNEGGLKRTLNARYTGESPPIGQLWFRIHIGKDLVLKDATCFDPNGVTVSLKATENQAVLRRAEQNPEWTEWRIRVHEGKSLEVNYQW